MTYTEPPLKTSTDVLTSDDWNTYVRDNMEEFGRSPTFCLQSGTYQQTWTDASKLRYVNWTSIVWDTEDVCSVPSDQIPVPGVGIYEVFASVRAQDVTVFRIAQFTGAGDRINVEPQSSDAASMSVPDFTERGASMSGIVKVDSASNYLRVEMSFLPDSLLSAGTRTSTIYEARFVLTKI